MILFLVAAAVVGLAMGSLAVTAIRQIPQRDPVFQSWGRCPYCDSRGGLGGTIPIAGFALGKACDNCGARTSLRDASVELASGVLFVLAAWKFAVHVESVVYALFFWILLVLSFIDLEHRLLPDRVVFPSLVAGVAGLVVAAVVRGHPEGLAHAALGAAIFGGFLFVVAFIHPAGMGGGDVKLSFLLGMFLGYLDGWGVVLVGMFLSFVLGGVIGLIVMVVTGGGRKMQVPFGPFLALGTVVAVFAGRAILTAYLG
jgi:leader peptidase (prepilin peptidase) / N-methyltransferase